MSHHRVYLKLLYCEFQNYEVMDLSVVGGQPKKHINPSYKATKDIERTLVLVYIHDIFEETFLLEALIRFYQPGHLI